jgi:hypothetical protein
VDPDGYAGLGGRDGRDQTGEAAADTSDLLHDKGTGQARLL